MRKMNVVLSLLAISSSCLCQEKMKIDLNASAIRTEPEVTTGRGMSGDNTRRNVIWRVDSSLSAITSPGSTTLEIRVSNVSAMPRTLPLSQDGVKLVAECPDHTVLQGALFLGSKADNKYFRQVGIFYGCESLPATVVQLMPGEWVSYVTKISTDRLPKEVRTQIRLVHTRYRQGPNGQTAEDLEYDTSEFSPWVSVPEAPRSSN